MSIDTATVAERDLLRPLRYLWRVPLLAVHAVLAIQLAFTNQLQVLLVGLQEPGQLILRHQLQVLLDRN